MAVRSPGLLSIERRVLAQPTERIFSRRILDLLEAAQPVVRGRRRSVSGGFTAGNGHPWANEERESDMLALMLPMAIGTGVVVIVVAIAIVLIVLFVTLSMRGRQRRKAKLRDQNRVGP